MSLAPGLLAQWQGEALGAGLQALAAAQRLLLAAMHGLGLVGLTSEGQPAWPWSQRLALDLLALDHGLARSLLLGLLLLATALALGALAAVWRRPRRWLQCGAALALACGVWASSGVADPQLLLAPAVPTSFHRSPTGFSAQSIVAGAALYQRLCASCHGEQGRGDGRLAGQGPMWPPDLGTSLLARRPEGELLWRLLHGMQDARQRLATMPGFAAQLQPGQAWQLLDFLRAQAAGQALQQRGLWELPVPLPDFAVHCGKAPPRSPRSWAGQRLRLVAAGPGVHPALLREDPRFVTVLLGAADQVAGGDPAQPLPAMSPGLAECRTEEAQAWAALAHLAGLPPAQLAGTQFIADRQGWLRARAVAGQAGWRAGDLVCRATASPTAVVLGDADALDSLLARMDAQPVRPPGGGLH